MHQWNRHSNEHDVMQTQTRMSQLMTIFNERPKARLFIAAAALRLILTLSFPAVPDLISLRAEVATPVNGFKRCT